MKKLKIPKWPAIRVGILSLFDLKGEWTRRQIVDMMPPPKRRGSLNANVLRTWALMETVPLPQSSQK